MGKKEKDFIMMAIRCSHDGEEISIYNKAERKWINKLIAGDYNGLKVTSIELLAGKRMNNNSFMAYNIGLFIKPEVWGEWIEQRSDN